jgi:hypothetical protein
MHLAYFDESGDSGPVATSPTRFFVLGCVMMHESVWRVNLDTILAMRRRARLAAGIPVTAELKAAHIRKGRGALLPLRWSPDRRGKFLGQLLRWQDKHLQLKSFAIAIDKQKLQAGRDPRELAWQYALQRVDTFCRKGGSNAMLFPDAGHGYFIRRLVRKIRRHQLIQGRFGGTLQVKAERIIEDPNDRQSHESLFVQLADWNAFAALRSQHVDPQLPAFATAWDKLGASLLLEVNAVRGGPPGIVRYP